MPTFGQTSRRRLSTCDQRIQGICNEAIKHFDFAVLCGSRGEAEQNRLFHINKSQLTYPKSKHNHRPSMAIDLAPWYQDKPHIRWGIHNNFIYLSGLIKGIAVMMDVQIRWGGDFNCNNDLADETFIDLPHYEIITSPY